MELFRKISVFAVILTLLSCGGDDSTFLNETLNSNSKRLLFVSSGGCYGGGVTLSTGSQTIAAFDLTTGAYHHTVLDYNVYAPGDNPVSIVEYDADNILVLVENTGGRRIDLVRKDGTSTQSYLTNGTALTTVMRALRRLSDGSMLVSKSTAIEKFGANKARVTQGANPWVNAPAAPCATTATLISGLDVFSNGKILYAHAAATPNNRIGLISATGYSVAGDCLASTAGPTTTALPTAIAIHPNGKTLVSYGSTTTASNLVYSYDIDSTANSIGGATSAWSDTAIVNGPTAMTVDSNTGKVYVASGLSTFNTIEEFDLNTAGVMTRTRTSALAGPNVYTKCVSSMQVMDYDP